MSIPDYTLEEKARAFDRLWVGCGAGRGELYTYKTKETISSYLADNKATLERVPVYHFKIAVDGHFYLFKEVLHMLATKK